MGSYLTWLFYLLLLEVARRMLLTLKTAFTGPMSKIPGPLIGKFSTIWPLTSAIKGNRMYAYPPMLKKYGDMVRVGRFRSRIDEVSSWELITNWKLLAAPNEIAVSGKAAIFKILYEEDMVKAPAYELFRIDKEVESLFDTRDKILHRQRVCIPFLLNFLVGWGLQNYYANCLLNRGDCILRASQ